MAKQKSSPATPVVPNFRDLDKEATQRAQAALSGGSVVPLTPPKTAKASKSETDSYTRWVESLTIVQAYRSVTKSGLMDVTVIAKVRQSDEPKNNGQRVFAHYFLDLGEDVSEGHEKMNDRSNGAILSLLAAAGFKPSNGTVSGSLLGKMFPEKNRPGATSPLNGKAVSGNIVQRTGPQKDPKTNKVVVGDDGKPVLRTQDNVESWLPEAVDESGDEE